MGCVRLVVCKKGRRVQKDFSSSITMIDQKLESAFANMVLKVLPNHKGVEDAVCYPFAEFIANIFEHSLSDRGYVFALLSHKKHMCIVDRGRGLAKTYEDELGYKFR